MRIRALAFAGNHKPDKREKTDNASNEHTPANDISEYNENCMQEVAHNCYLLNLPQI